MFSQVWLKLAPGAVLLILASCTTSANTGQTTTGTATFALQAGYQPNYIFPFLGQDNATVANGYLQGMLYRPLYYLGKNGSPELNDAASLADAPTFSNGNQNVTVHLRNFQWSDGSKLSPRNVAFFIGLASSEKDVWSGYSPGLFPDDIVSATYNDAANTFSLALDKPVGPQWFQYNVLTLLTPLPVAWDLTAAGQKGSCSSEDRQTQQSSCPAVYTYLNGLAKQTSNYADKSGPSSIWSVVDGPFTLDSYNPDGHMAFVPNKSYSGPNKAHLNRVEFLPFTSEDAEFNVLRSSNTISVGYIPAQSLQPKSSGGANSNPLAASYNLASTSYWGMNYLLMNYNNPVAGPIFRQLYIRQAINSVVDQDTDINVAYRGYGYPTYGPIPVFPANSVFLSSKQKAATYPFSVDAARKFLTDNGWTIPSSGPAVCSNPGTGGGQCGNGIAAGAKLQFALESYNGGAALDQIMQQFKTDAGKAGIVLNYTSLPGNQVVKDAAQCIPSDAKCKWQIINIGGSGYGGYPTGENYLLTGAGQNFSSYSDPQMDTLIKASVSSSSLDALYAYEDYAAQQVPFVWQPVAFDPLLEVAKNLHGVVFNSNYTFNAEDWSIS
jgi:peptide/nickel transport system substrate-binding protein